MSRTVVGIDPSSRKLALVATRTFRADEVPVTAVIVLPEGGVQAAAAFREVFLFLRRLGAEGIHVYLEEPVYAFARRDPHSTIVQAQIGGAVMAAARLAGASVHLANNQRWKKQVCGKGNASKDEIAASLQIRWPEAYDACQGDQDLVDAASVNRYGVENQRTVERIARWHSSKCPARTKKPNRGSKVRTIRTSR
jgi:Holliday junction resolvasome RuvABC endonuclease subunit